jgi:hypothetical protein
MRCDTFITLLNPTHSSIHETHIDPLFDSRIDHDKYVSICGRYS